MNAPELPPDLAELEARLRALAPAPAPRALEQATAARLQRPAVAAFPRRSHYALGGLLAAAAAVALLVSVAPPPAPSPADSSLPRWTRAGSETQEVGESDDGLVVSADGSWLRRVRLDYVDTVRWADPATGAQLVVTTPRQEIFVEPIRPF